METPAVAKRIIDEINRAVVIDGSEVIVGASIGSASAPDDGISPDALLSKADIALYAAKADGRRVWRAFEPAMDAKIQIRRLIELELRAAVANDGIDVHFQPIVAVGTRRIVGFEALARWQSAVLGAHISDRIHPDRRGDRAHGGDGRGRAEARLRGLRDVAGRRQRVGQSVPDAVPQRQSREDDPRRAGCRQALPDRLDLEITESTLLEDRGDTRRALQALRESGLRISLDDFGTGYSSLSYLLSFPLDRIKIDRTFTMGLGVQERASVLVESVASMSRRLGMCVLIEGVETAKQLKMIETLGTIARRRASCSVRRCPSRVSAASWGATFAIRPRRPPLPAPLQARSVLVAIASFQRLKCIFLSLNSISFVTGRPERIGKIQEVPVGQLSGLFLKNYIKPQSTWQGIVGFSYQASPLTCPTPPSAPPPAPARRRSAI